jgi:hypothetical protein
MATFGRMKLANCRKYKQIHFSLGSANNFNSLWDDCASGVPPHGKNTAAFPGENDAYSAPVIELIELDGITRASENQSVETLFYYDDSDQKRSISVGAAHEYSAVSGPDLPQRFGQVAPALTRGRGHTGRQAVPGAPCCTQAGIC